MKRIWLKLKESGSLKIGRRSCMNQQASIRS
jgi:hypothetical protein